MPGVRNDLFVAHQSIYTFAIPYATGAVVLDAGCGTGYGSRLLADAGAGRVLGLDVDRLSVAPQHRVMLPGGTVRYSSGSLIGALVGDTMTGLRFDTLYLGADAIDADFGLSTFNEDEARQSAAMVRLAARVVVLADSSKFRAPSLHRIAGLADIDIIVTDSGLAPQAAERLALAGVEVISADPVAVATARPRQSKDRIAPSHAIPPEPLRRDFSCRPPGRRPVRRALPR